MVICGSFCLGGKDTRTEWEEDESKGEMRRERVSLIRISGNDHEVTLCEEGERSRFAR